MKTLLVLSALTAVALAAPFEQGAEDIKHLLNLNIPDDRERIEAETAVNLPSSSHVQFGVTGRSFGLKKPIIFKKKPLGYQVYRDSEEVPSESGETCGSQIKVKFCDGKAKSKTTSIGGNNPQNEEDMKHSLTLAKEAIENLERDFSKVENTKANSWNHGKLKADVELHQDIEVAREALAHILTHFGNFETMSLDATTMKEANVAAVGPFAIAKTEEQRLAQWKDAIDTIQKNVEIAKNIEDSFRMASVDETKIMMESNSMMNENNIPELNKEMDSIMRTADNVEPEQKNEKAEKTCKNGHKKTNERELESDDMAVSASTISENKDNAIQTPELLGDNKIEQTVNSDISMKNKNLEADNLTILENNKENQDKNKEEQSQNHVEQKDTQEQQGQNGLEKNETDLKQEKNKNDLDNNKGEQGENKAEINLSGQDVNKVQDKINDGQNQILGHEGHTKEEHDTILGNQGENKKDQDQTAEGQDKILKSQGQINSEQEKIEEKQHSKEEQNKITEGQDKILGHEGHTKEEQDRVIGNQGQNKEEQDNITQRYDKNIDNQGETTQEPAKITEEKNIVLGNQGLNKQGQDSSKESLESTTEGQWKKMLGHEEHNKEEHEKITKEKNGILENQDKNKEKQDNGKGELGSAIDDQNKMPGHEGHSKEEHAKIIKNPTDDKVEQNKISDEKDKILENLDKNKEGQDSIKEGLDSTTEGQWKKMLGHEGHNKEEHDRIIGIPSQNKEDKISDNKDHNVGSQDQNKKRCQDKITEEQTKVLGHEGHSKEEHDRIIENQSQNKEDQDKLTQEKDKALENEDEKQIAENQDKILENQKENKKSEESEEQNKIVKQQNQNEEKQDLDNKEHSQIIKGQSQTQVDQENNQVEQDKALTGLTVQEKKPELRDNADSPNISVIKMRSPEAEDQLFLTLKEFDDSSNIKNKDEPKLQEDLHTEQSKQVETLFLKSAEVPTFTQDNFFNSIVQEKMAQNGPEIALPKMANNIDTKTHHTVFKSSNDAEELEMQHALPMHSSGMRSTEHMPNFHQQHKMTTRSRWADEKNKHMHHRDWMTSPKGIHSHVVQHPGHHHHITHGMRTQNQHFEMPTNQGLHTRFPGNLMTQEKAANPEFQAHYMSMREPQMLENSKMPWKSMGPRSAYGTPGAPGAPIAAIGPQGGGAVGVFPNAHVGSCGIPLLLSCNPSVVSGNLAKPASVPYSAPSYRTEEDLSFLTKRDLKKGHENQLNTLRRTSKSHEKISTVSVAEQ